MKMETKQIFKNFELLKAEITKRNYNNIEGLKAEITAEQFNYFLNVLYPLNWNTEKNTFLLNEPLTENLYYGFSQIGIKFYCEVLRYNMNKEELFYYG